MAIEHEAYKIQIYGDYEVIIKWITWKNRIQLDPVLEEVHRLIEQLEKMEIKHIYMERNV